MRNVFLIILLVASAVSVSQIGNAAYDQMPTIASMTTDLAGGSSGTALSSLFRVLCPPKRSAGTGFLHKSGKVITASHVVSGCAAQELILLNAQGQKIRISNVIDDPVVDLALLTPAQDVKSATLSLSDREQHVVGSQVSTWGYPEGYNGLEPLLRSGYVSGTDNVQGPS